jgi:hypothetical protein
VINITLRTFPTSNIWGGFLYTTSNQSAKVLSAFYDSVNHTSPDTTSRTYDSHVAGPIACFTYLHQLRIQAVSVNLVYTSVPENTKEWPKYWNETPFKSIWRLWSTFKVRTLANACEEMNALNPPGRRQVFGTTTIKNDMKTITATHEAFTDSIADIKRANVKAMSWTLVLQPLSPHWGRKGDTNPLGFQDGDDEPLVNISLTVNWAERQDDHEAKRFTKETIQRIEKAARDMGTTHRYRYMNYCGAWQNPFKSYGEDNVLFLKGVSRKYDPHRLFQEACVGGFKLDCSTDNQTIDSVTLSNARLINPVTSAKSAFAPVALVSHQRSPGIIRETIERSF